MSDSTTQTPTTLVIRRIFNAPPARVYAAWAQPDRMRAWLAPGEMVLKEYVSDPRVGGAFRLTMQEPGGEPFAARGVYREMRDGELLSFTWSWEEDTPEEEVETFITLEFLDHANGTELIFTHERLRDEASRDRHNEGWNSCLDKLAGYLAA